MKISITREMVRHAARSVCPFIGLNGGINENGYCHTCIISDALYRLIPDSLKPYHTVQTVSGSRIELISRVTGKITKIHGDSAKADAIIRVFDRVMLTTPRKPIDSIYYELKRNKLLEVELDDPRPLLDNVQVVYKAFIDTANNLQSCCGSKYDLKYNPKDDRWVFPTIGKMFCLNEPNSVPYSVLYKCLALNPVSAKCQAYVDGFQTSRNVELFWDQYHPNKEMDEYSCLTESTRKGTMFADAIKILEPA
jgi:hypothetical protein